MDYRLLAEQLVNLQSSLHVTPASRMLSALDRGELLALNYLVLHENAAYPKELSRGMAVSSARVAALLNHLERQGLTRRAPDPADSRQVIVSLTEAGLMEIRRKREEIIQTAMQILEELGPEDAKALLRIQEKLVRSSLRQTQALAPPDTTKKRREPSR